MKRIVAPAVVLVCLAGVAVSRGTQSKLAAERAPAAAKAATSSPLACDREALTPEERKRHFEELGPALRKLKTGVRELPDGFEFEFPGDRATYQLLTEWVAGERVCCPFFDIALASDREGGPLRLRLAGRKGVKHFIEVEGRSWLEKTAAK